MLIIRNLNLSSVQSWTCLDLLLNRRTTTWNLFVKYKPALAKNSPLFKRDLKTKLFP